MWKVPQDGRVLAKGVVAPSAGRIAVGGWVSRNLKEYVGDGDVDEENAYTP